MNDDQDIFDVGRSAARLPGRADHPALERSGPSVRDGPIRLIDDLCDRSENRPRRRIDRRDHAHGWRTVVITRRQIDALQAAFTHGSPWKAGPAGTRGNAGGAFARMGDDLRSKGYLCKERESNGRTTEITAPGMRTLPDWDRGRRRPTPAP